MRLEKESGGVVCERCVVADRPFRRMKGLLGRKSLPAEEGILLRPAGSIHTWFMAFPIDVVFLDRDQVVLRVDEAVPPRQLRARKGAKAVLELAAGAAAGLAPGDRLVAR